MHHPPVIHGRLRCGPGKGLGSLPSHSITGCVFVGTFLGKNGDFVRRTRRVPYGLDYQRPAARVYQIENRPFDFAQGKQSKIENPLPPFPGAVGNARLTWFSAAQDRLARAKDEGYDSTHRVYLPGWFPGRRHRDVRGHGRRGEVGVSVRRGVRVDRHAGQGPGRRQGVHHHRRARHPGGAGQAGAHRRGLEGARAARGPGRQPRRQAGGRRICQPWPGRQAHLHRYHRPGRRGPRRARRAGRR